MGKGKQRGGETLGGTPPGLAIPHRPIPWLSAWRAALQRPGLQIRFHELRHACITKLAQGQASEQTIMAIAGPLS